ncbi:Protein kinase domain [Phytophthora infestans]|uniref:Protein kinase domain n=1 Tax=Phytophthora infestans TaxID=4787 RepID=A0A833SHF9_PHYIN|nr:Protein kinase domain [Phytophthora infestans]
MGNQASVLLSEEASELPAMHGSQNARVLSLPPELSAVESSSSEPQVPTRAHELLSSTDASAPAASPAAPRRRVEDFYDVQTELLGRGHYATVCRGRCRRTDRAVAIKKVKRFMTDPKRLRSEITALRRVKQHPNIVELIDVFETTREVHLVLELCTGGELFERLAEKGAYSEADCVRHVRDMASAVQYLHECGIVHRDLKPENILLSTSNEHDAVVKVADFGLAKIFAGTNLKTKCGTWGYSAPEMISGSGSAFGYDDKVDSWSLGTVLYILLCGYHPFDPEGERSDNEMIASIKSCSFEFDDDGWGTISDEAKDLVRHLLVLDPDDRFSMTQVLEHPWIVGSSSAAALQASGHPLSPTIHQELAKYREHTKQKSGFGPYDDRDDDESQRK